MFGLDDRDYLLAGTGAQHVMPPRRSLEGAAEGGRGVRFVVDDEDPGHRESERRAAIREEGTSLHEDDASEATPVTIPVGAAGRGGGPPAARRWLPPTWGPGARR